MFESIKKGLLPKLGITGDNGPSTNFDTTRHESLSTLELAQLVLSDTVRRNSIPKDWLTVECLEVVLRPGLNQTHLQLVMQR
jgi:hypothetical protein